MDIKLWQSIILINLRNTDYLKGTHYYKLKLQDKLFKQSIELIVAFIFS
mgnify:CR=1 FL=1